MNVSSKSSNTQMFRMMIYCRALHPELFEIQRRTSCSHGPYNSELWIGKAGHVARFNLGGCTLVETVIEEGDHLPETGLVHALPCLGEKDYELEADPSKTIGYVTTLQTELLTENLYAATYREMRDFAHEANALSYEWDAAGVPGLSVLDYQKYKSEFHIQSYHLVGASGLVLRTQSIFEVL